MSRLVLCQESVARTWTDQPKPGAQQLRHKGIRFAFGAASARLRPAS